MYSIKAERSTNTLYVELNGFFDVEEIKKASEEACLKASQLQKGFFIINDISKFKPGSPEVSVQIKETQKKLFEKGASKTIRVVGDAFLSNMQFNRTQKEAGADYELITVKTMEEAKQIVAK